jgi:hypothetical protein
LHQHQHNPGTERLPYEWMAIEAWKASEKKVRPDRGFRMVLEVHLVESYPMWSSLCVDPPLRVLLMLSEEKVLFAHDVGEFRYGLEARLVRS